MYNVCVPGAHPVRLLRSARIWLSGREGEEEGQISRFQLSEEALISQSISTVWEPETHSIHVIVITD